MIEQEIDKYKWKARASKAGYYFNCAFRAAFDKAFETGDFELPDELQEKLAENKVHGNSPPADFGTVTHWEMQVFMNCLFCPDFNELPSTYDAVAMAEAKYDNDQTACATKLFQSEKEMFAMSRKIASQAAQLMPQDKEWYAESWFKTDVVEGHIDFLSRDLSVIVDLKTTNAKPPGGRMRVEHMWQVVVYAYMVHKVTGTLPDQAYVLYAGRDGTWALMSKPIDFHTSHGRELINHVDSYLRFLCEDSLYATAVPNLACGCDWCPYTEHCRNAYLPAKSYARQFDSVEEAVVYNPLVL